MKIIKTVKEWEEDLNPSEVEALHDNVSKDPNDKISANEVLDAIVDWEGGIASGYQIRSIVSRVYGVELE